jgi:hypothetical protein
VELHVTAAPPDPDQRAAADVPPVYSSSESAPGR